MIASGHEGQGFESQPGQDKNPLGRNKPHNTLPHKSVKWVPARLVMLISVNYIYKWMHFRYLLTDMLPRELRMLQYEQTRRPGVKLSQMSMLRHGYKMQNPYLYPYLQIGLLFYASIMFKLVTVLNAKNTSRKAGDKYLESYSSLYNIADAYRV